MVARGGLGGVTGDNGDGSGRRGQGAAELAAKDGFRTYKPVQEHVGKNVPGSDPVIHKGLKSSDGTQNLPASVVTHRKVLVPRE